MTRRSLALGALTILALALPHVAAASPGALSARTEVWMERTLRVTIEGRPLVQADTTGCGGVATALWGCDAIAWHDRTELSPPTWEEVDQVSRTGHDPHQRGRLLMHEILHQSHAAWTPADLEEGIVEALAMDLYAAWGRAMGLRSWPREDVYSTPYPVQVAAIRKASALATGKPWKDRAARQWRRDLWKADAPTRVALYEAVGLG